MGKRSDSDKAIGRLQRPEHNGQHRAASQGQAPYDNNWMWVELKLRE